MNHPPLSPDNFSRAISISFFEVCKNTYEQHSVHYTCVINTRGKFTTRVNETVKHFTDHAYYYSTQHLLLNVQKVFKKTNLKMIHL
jgi:hypothetical protein